MGTRVKIECILALLALLSAPAHAADNRRHLCEFGLEGGCGYYLGDATSLPFQNVREAYGANFRYRFDQRWALQVQGIAHRITGSYPEKYQKGTEKWQNQLVNLDVSAEFNFFRFGAKNYDRRVKPITPYIYCGLGMCMHSQFKKFAAYIPFGVGVKWKFAPQFNLQLAVQNNICFTDNLEGVPELNNPQRLNGSNPLNFDQNTTICLGLTVEFIKEKKICRLCQR